MSSRPLVAFFSEVAPHPAPLYGGQIRVDRLIREFLEEFDVAFVCQSPVTEATLRKEWSLSERLTRIICVPGTRPSSGRDPLWGPLGVCGEAAARYARPGSRPASQDALWSEDLVSRARQLLDELPIDAVWASRAWMAEMARAAGAKTILVDVGDFEGPLSLTRLSASPFYRRKPLHWLQAMHLREYERDLPARFEGLSVVKSEDLQFIDHERRTGVNVVPNGVDVPGATPVRSPRPLGLLFVGALWYDPNVEALREFVTTVFPKLEATLPGVTLTVAGRGPVSTELKSLLARPGVTLRVSPPSLVELYAEAAICVAPLRIGGGTSIKVLEALAFGVPTVASPVAARGLELRAGTHLEIADSPDEFVAACVDLLTNCDRAQALGASGREEVRRRHSWQHVGIVARNAMRRLLQTTNGDHRL